MITFSFFKDGHEHGINPIHIESFHGASSDYGHSKSFSLSIILSSGEYEVIPCASEEELNEKIEYVKTCINSIPEYHYGQ